MALRKASPVMDSPPAEDLTVIRTEIISQSGPLTRSVSSLAVVDNETYAKADSLLSRVCNVRTSLTARVGVILEPLDNAKREIDKSRKELTRFRDELDRPLQIMENDIRGMMQEFKREERRLLQEAETKRQLEAHRLQQEADKARQASATAATPQAQRRLENKAMDLETRVDVSLAAPREAPVQAAHSGSRVVKKVRIANLKALLQAVVAGDLPIEIIPQDAILSGLEYIRRTKGDAFVGSFPGVEVYEDVQIVRRGS